MSGVRWLRESGAPYIPVFVVDASAVLAALVDDAWSERARQLLLMASKGELGLVVPQLFWYEVANVLRYHFANDADALTQNLRLAAATPVATVTIDPEDMSAVAALALAEALTVYDAAYLFLAQRSGCNLITQDRRLLGAAGGRFSRSLEDIGL